MINNKKKEAVWVYVYRDTVEPGYCGDDNIVRILVELDFMEQYVKETSQYKDFKNWNDYYTCDDTIDLYEKASSVGAIQKVEYETLMIVEDVSVRNINDLAYKALRIMEISGKPELGEKIYTEATDESKVQEYTDARSVIRKYLEVAIKKENIESYVRQCICVKIKADNVIDFVVKIGRYEEPEMVEALINIAYNEWFDKNEEVGNIPLIDYIEKCLNKECVDCEIYMKFTED